MSKNLLTSKDMINHLYDHFSGVHQAAVSHVMTDENGDHLYLALIKAEGQTGNKTHAAGAGPATHPKHEHGDTHEGAHGGSGAHGHVTGAADDLDTSMSRQVINLLHHPLTWDGCDSKIHCAGAGPATRPRKQHTEARVPAGTAHHGVEAETAIAHPSSVTTVPHADVAKLFDLMDKVSAYGIRSENA
jgi:hypothetical protein